MVLVIILLTGGDNGESGDDVYAYAHASVPCPCKPPGALPPSTEDIEKAPRPILLLMVTTGAIKRDGGVVIPLAVVASSFLKSALLVLVLVVVVLALVMVGVVMVVV